MSLVAAYSDSDSENEAEEDSSESQSKVCTQSNEINKNDSTSHDHDPIPSEKEKISQDFQIVDDDNWLGGNPKTNVSHDSQSTLFSLLPQPKPQKSDVVEEVDDEFIKKVNKYESIDKPVDPSELSNKKEKEIEKPLNRTSLILPKPSKTSGKRSTVKISIPTLEDIGANSDSDEEESKNTPINVPPACKKKSTLFSMLPKPRHSVTVGANKNKMFTQQANRPLVPHTLTKKKEPVKNTKTNSKKVKQTNSLVGDFSDSDNDENDVSDNFFSLGESTTHGIDIPTTISLVSSSNVSVSSSSSSSDTAKLPSTISVSSSNTAALQKTTSTVESNLKHTPSKKKYLPTDERLNDKGNSFFVNLYKSDVNTKTVKSNTNRKLDGNSSTVPASNVVTTSHTNLTTKNTNSSKGNVTSPCKNATVLGKNVASKHGDVTGPYGDVTGPYGDVTGPYGGVTGPYGGVTAPYGGVTSYENTREPNRTYENFTAGGDARNEESSVKSYPTSQHFFTNKPCEKLSETVDVPAEVDYSNTPNEDSVIDNDAWRLLQGSKRKRGNINIIDIQGVDVRGDKKVLLRNLTSEEHVQQRMKQTENEPTQSQKRKHQIHYLAHQAKERELQLQQAWAESRATKQHTQSRYGF